MGVRTQGLMLVRKALYHLNHSARPIFVLRIFELGLASNFTAADICLLIIDLSHQCLTILLFFEVTVNKLFSYFLSQSVH
jgi:hypothetical protein